MVNNIKTLRVEKNLSQEKLAKQVHVTQTAVSQWEKGKTTPDMSTAYELAKLFNVSVDYLLGRTQERNTSFIANNNHGSHIVQNAGNLSSIGENSSRELSPEEIELLRIFSAISVKDRHKLLDCAFSLEQQEER